MPHAHPSDLAHAALDEVADEVELTGASRLTQQLHEVVATWHALREHLNDAASAPYVCLDNSATRDALERELNQLTLAMGYRLIELVERGGEVRFLEPDAPFDVESQPLAQDPQDIAQAHVEVDEAPAREPEPEAPSAPPQHAREPERAAAPRPEPAPIDPDQVAMLKRRLEGGNWMRHVTDDVAATKPKPVVASELDRIIRQLGSPGPMSTGAQLSGEVGQLRAATRDDQLERWFLLDRRERRALVHYLVSRARATQVCAEEIGQSERVTEAIREIFTTLHRYLNQGESLGFIHGLALSHQPKHSDDWVSETLHWRDVLKELAGQAVEQEAPAQEEAVTTRATVRARIIAPPPSPSEEVSEVEEDEQEDDDEELIPEDWAFWDTIRGKRVIMVGGSRRAEAERRICDTFEPLEFEWMEMERDRKPERAKSICRRIEHGNVDLVILLKRFVNHSTSGRIVESIKKAEVPCAFVDRGYGVSQIRMAIERFA